MRLNAPNLPAADYLHTVFARIQSAGQRLIVMPEWNNRHVCSRLQADALYLITSNGVNLRRRDRDRDRDRHTVSYNPQSLKNSIPASALLQSV
jgi:hypothetical protein